MTELAPQVIVWSVVLVSYFLTWRSRSRRERGVCCACGTKPATVALALDRFCEACARKTARTYRAGSRFFAFILLFCVFAFSWMWLEFRGQDESPLPWGEFVAALFLMAALVVWLRRPPARRDASR